MSKLSTEGTYHKQKPLKKTSPPWAPSWQRAYYKTGDGDVITVKRVGSDHSHLKSYGNLT